MNDPVPAPGAAPGPATSDAGKPLAFAVYVLYLLSIPSVFTLLLVGWIIALATRRDASGWVRTHFDNQVRIGWTVLWWTIGLAILTGVGMLLTPLLVGLPIWGLALLLGFVVAIWLVLKSVLGLIALSGGKPV